MCMSGGGSNSASQTKQETPQQVSLPPAQQQLAASGSIPSAVDPSRPKAGQRRARENAKYADKTNPNMRRGDAGGITM